MLSAIDNLISFATFFTCIIILLAMFIQASTYMVQLYYNKLLCKYDKKTSIGIIVLIFILLYLILILIILLQY